jgi:hypothetical protein
MHVTSAGCALDRVIRRNAGVEPYYGAVAGSGEFDNAAGSLRVKFGCNGGLRIQSGSGATLIRLGWMTSGAGGGD